MPCSLSSANLAFDQSNDRANRTFRSFSNGGGWIIYAVIPFPRWGGGKGWVGSRLVVGNVALRERMLVQPLLPVSNRWIMERWRSIRWWNCFERGRVPPRGGEGESIEIWCYYWYMLLSDGILHIDFGGGSFETSYRRMDCITGGKFISEFRRTRGGCFRW